MENQNKKEMTTDEIVKLASRTAIEIYEGQMQKKMKEKHDRKLRNTELLLQNYRSFASYNRNAVSNLYEALKIDEDIYSVLEMMEGRENKTSSVRIDSIEKGVLRTKIMMAHVEAMLESYRKKCEQSPCDEEMRRYRVIKAMYLDEKEMTVEQIAEQESCDITTVYRDRKNAITKLAALIFGIDGIMFNAK